MSKSEHQGIQAIDDQDGNIILTIDEITNRWHKSEHQGIQAIDDQDGNIILTIDEITNRWQQYYMNIMEGHLNMISDNNNTSNKEEYDITVQEISVKYHETGR
ncbi:hypothetical protein QE152_g5249 [Popillia japonica]|uniref:Uncharacterized protein n=1 Tax=Popillia japonica TaxID=7064 RepID=A0AAW1MNN6_POPJA